MVKESDDQKVKRLRKEYQRAKDRQKTIYMRIYKFFSKFK